METKVKWNEGDGYITATYEGSGNGSASISSDVNEGIDREQTIKVETTDKSVSASLVVSQVGLREVFNASDDDFVLADGGTFNVLKGDISYTELNYIEADGQQAITLDYIVKETDIIEMEYTVTLVSNADKFLFAGANTWVSQYNASAYVRFGYTSSATTSYIRSGKALKLQKGALYVDGTKRLTLSYSSMGTTPLTLFAGKNTNGDFYKYGYCQCRLFRITNGNGEVVMSLKPMMRNDGAVGLLDEVSGRFYTNDGNGRDFLYG